MIAEIYLATSNEHKIEELSPLFSRFGIVLKQAKVEKLEIQNSELQLISEFAVRKAYDKIRKPIIVDDTGLYIDELNGFPGPYAHFVLDTIGRHGILKLMNGISNRSAKFITSASICISESICKTFLGVLEGTIAEDERGSYGFGYDSIFIPQGMKYTLAELDLLQKVEISHRTKAFTKLIKWLKDVDVT